MFEQNAPLVEIVGLTIGAHDLGVCDVCRHGLSNFMGCVGFVSQPRPQT